MALNQDKALLCICPLFVRDSPLLLFSFDNIGCKCSSSPLMRWLWIRTINIRWPWIWTRNGCCNGFFPYFFPYVFEAFHFHPYSVDNIASKCSSGLFIRLLWIRTRNCCWNGFIPYSFEASHCHPSSFDNIGCKCSSSPSMRWLWIVMDLSIMQSRLSSCYLFLIYSRRSIAICLLLLI